MGATRNTSALTRARIVAGRRHARIMPTACTHELFDGEYGNERHHYLREPITGVSTNGTWSVTLSVIELYSDLISQRLVAHQPQPLDEGAEARGEGDRAPVRYNGQQAFGRHFALSQAVADRTPSCARHGILPPHGDEFASDEGPTAPPRTAANLALARRTRRCASLSSRRSMASPRSASGRSARARTRRMLAPTSS